MGPGERGPAGGAAIENRKDLFILLVPLGAKNAKKCRAPIFSAGTVQGDGAGLPLQASGFQLKSMGLHEVLDGPNRADWPSSWFPGRGFEENWLLEGRNKQRLGFFFRGPTRAGGASRQRR